MFGKHYISVINHKSHVKETTTKMLACDAAFFWGGKKTAASSVWRMMVHQK